MTNEEFLTNIGMEFRIARVRKKLTIPQLAEKTGLSGNAISALENGKYDSHILTYKRLFDALEMDMKVLV